MRLTLSDDFSLLLPPNVAIVTTSAVTPTTAAPIQSASAAIEKVRISLRFDSSSFAYVAALVPGGGCCLSSVSRSFEFLIAKNPVTPAPTASATVVPQSTKGHGLTPFLIVMVDCIESGTLSVSEPATVTACVAGM